MIRASLLLLVFGIHFVASGAIKQDISEFNLKACPREAPYCLNIHAKEAHAGYLPTLYILKGVRVSFHSQNKTLERSDLLAERAHLNHKTNELILDEKTRVNLNTLEVESLIPLESQGGKK